MSPLPEVLFAVARNPVLAVGLPIGLGAISGFITGKEARSPWYLTMKQPPGAPPRQAFGPTWTILYGLMGYASHLAVRAFDAAVTPAGTVSAQMLGEVQQQLTRSAQADEAFQLYWAQLALNLIWTPLFFGAKKPELALCDIAVLTGTVFSLTAKMAKLNTPISTTWFLAPYCAWLGYATYINAGVVYLNRNRKA